jgi:hypothetical protein
LAASTASPDGTAAAGAAFLAAAGAAGPSVAAIFRFSAFDAATFLSAAAGSFSTTTAGDIFKKFLLKEKSISVNDKKNVIRSSYHFVTVVVEREGGRWMND